MNIVVLVKHVPEPTAQWRFGGDLTLDRTAVDGRLSELDEYAVEQAVRLAEARPDARVTYLTMGPAKAVDGLRKALAMGGDQAVHVVDDALHGTDAVGTAVVLARAIARIGFDLVLCGMASTDAEMSVVPAMVADLLGVPQLTHACELRVEDGSVTVRRESDRTTDELVAALPAVVSVTDQTGEARYPSFKAIMAGRKKPVTTWSLADLEIAADAVGTAGAGTVVRSVTPTPPRQAGEVVVDDGDGAARIAEFLAARALV
jgi:electron transfer flavoprotein beta subunit